MLKAGLHCRLVSKNILTPKRFNNYKLQRESVCQKWDGADVVSREDRCLCVTFFFSCLCVAIFRKAALLFGWAVFLLLAYKVSKLDREYQEYNPYEVLNLDPVNTHKT